MDNKAKALISQFYQEEEQKAQFEKSFSQVNVSLKESDIAMLEAIASRFGTSKEALAREALSGAIYNMFEALDSKERKSIAKEADDTTPSEGDDKSVAWVMNDRAVTREENRLKKLQAQEEQKKVENQKPEPTEDKKTEAPKQVEALENDDPAENNATNEDKNNTPAEELVASEEESQVETAGTKMESMFL